MKKLRFDKGSEAIARNAKAAEDKNYDMIHAQACWGYFRDEKGFYLEIPEEDEHLLTTAEKNRLEE